MPYVHIFCLHRMGTIPNRKPISMQENKTVWRLPYFLDEHYFLFDFTLNLKNLQEILNFFNVTLTINSRKPIETIKYVTALMSSMTDEMFIHILLSCERKIASWHKQQYYYII